MRQTDKQTNRHTDEWMDGWAGRQLDRICTLGAGASCLLFGPPRFNWCFSFAPELVGYSAPWDLHRRAAYSICESLFLIHQDVYHDLFVCS